MIVIAAPRFDAASETFICNHVRTIAPGETALLCLSEDGIREFAVPALSALRPGWRSSRSLYRRALNELGNRWSNRVRPGLSSQSHGRVVDFLTKIEATAVLAEYGPTGCLLMDSCAEAQVPLYVHFHGYDASRLLNKRLWRRNYRRIFTSAAGIIVPSRFLGQKLIEAGCPELTLHVAPCGIDPDLFTPTSRLPQRMLAVGRFVEKKAPHLTIAAFAKIADRFPEATLDMVGDGPLMQRCRDLVLRRGLGSRIRLSGSTAPATVANLMRSASLFVQHSVTASNGDMESLGISLIEAMACEIPVVTTRHNGFPQTVEDGVTGLLVDEHDIAGMATAMAKLLDDSARAEAMGKAGRQRVLENFTLDKSRDRIRSIMGLRPIEPVQ